MTGLPPSIVGWVHFIVMDDASMSVIVTFTGPGEARYKKQNKRLK
jgi:hypothetical protein